MKYLLLAALSIGTFLQAQYAKVTDRDGFVNVRKGAGTNSEVVGKIKSGEIIYIFNLGNDSETWLIVDYRQPNGKLLTGYVHNSKLKEISTYSKIPLVKVGDNAAVFKGKGISVEIKSGLFDYEANKKYFSTSKYGNHEITDLYKGREIWGFDSSVSLTYYKSIIAQLGNITIMIPAKDLEGLFNINNQFADCHYDERSKTLYIMARNADGAETYDVLFIIKNGKYFGRKVYGYS